jgi:superfamily II DNA/RNA helicase
MSQQSFAELGVSRAVVTALSQCGYTAPFQIQREVIGDVLAGRDVLARSPTGSGKTLAFGIPMIDRTAAEARRPAALVLAPTRELATQIVDELEPIAHARALRVTAVYGGVGLLKQAQSAARAHIVVATPGRLEDQLERGAFTLDHVRTLVIDEADRMLDMGFRPALDRIVALCPTDRQTMFFSATLDGDAGKAARRYTNNAAFHEHGPSERRASADVEHRFVAVSHESRIDSLLEHLSQEQRDLTLVFVRTKHGADKLVKKLSGAGVAAVAMHGNKTQAQRERALAQFDSFAVDTLVATDVAARGIDVSGISHVINFDPPHDSETYVHRVGRTGRAGATGIGITLYSPDQKRDVARMASDLGIDSGLDGGPSLGAVGFKRTEFKPRPAGGGDARGGRPRSGRGGNGPSGGGQSGRGSNGHSGGGQSGRGANDHSGSAQNSKGQGASGHNGPARGGKPAGSSHAGNGRSTPTYQGYKGSGGSGKPKRSGKAKTGRVSRAG